MIREYEEKVKLRKNRKRTSSNSTIVSSAALSDTGATKKRKRDTTLKLKVDKANKCDKVAKKDKANKVDKTIKVDTACKVHRVIKVEKSENVDRAIKVEKSVNVDKAGLIPTGPQKEAEKILAATEESGEIVFFVKWKDLPKADLIPAKEANLMFPQVVIKYYQEKLTWCNA